MWTRPIWSGLQRWRLAKGKSTWGQLRSDVEYSWLNLVWSVENTTQRTEYSWLNLVWSVENTTQRTHEWDSEAESTPAVNAAELNQALKRVEEKDIEKSFHCISAMLCCCYWKGLEWKVFRVGWREEWNCLERKQCDCDFLLFMWFWSVWNVKRIGSGIMWVWMMNSYFPHWKSYNKEGRKCLFLLFVRNYPSRCNSSATHWKLI